MKNQFTDNISRILTIVTEILEEIRYLKEHRSMLEGDPMLEFSEQKRDAVRIPVQSKQISDVPFSACCMRYSRHIGRNAYRVPTPTLNPPQNIPETIPLQCL